MTISSYKGVMMKNNVVKGNNKLKEVGILECLKNSSNTGVYITMEEDAQKL